MFKKIVLILSKNKTADFKTASEALVIVLRPIVLIAAVVYLHMMYLLLNDIRYNLVYDVDKSRNKFMNETRYMFRKGCEAGNEYACTFDRSQYSAYSLSEFCTDQFKDQEDYLMRQSIELGQKLDKYGEVK